MNLTATMGTFVWAMKQPRLLSNLVSTSSVDASTCYTSYIIIRLLPKIWWTSLDNFAYTLQECELFCHLHSINQFLKLALVYSSKPINDCQNLGACKTIHYSYPFLSSPHNGCQPKTRSGETIYSHSVCEMIDLLPKIYVIVITWAIGICLIYMPTPSGHTGCFL